MRAHLLFFALVGCVFLGCGRSDLETFPYGDASVNPLGDSAADACGADVMNDPKNCGACSNACAPDAICKTGSCTPCPSGFLVCSNACVDGLGDAKNCGGCGKTCAANQVCAAGLCALSCPIGRSKCGSDCVDVLKDPNNCGGCGLTCKGGETCASGLCCPSGQSNCAGACVDLTSDPKNCGMCGNPCAMTCSNSKCGTCKKDVLVLADASNTTSDLVKAIQGAGYTVTLASVAQYSGTPAASGFGALLLTNGTQWSVDMPAAGQSAITSAQGSGAGVVLTEWFNYEIEQARYQNLKSLQLFTRQSGVDAKLTFASQVAHPIWSGLPATFTTVNAMGTNVSGSLVNAATTIATCAQCGSVGVAVKDSNTAGRVVQIAHAASFNNGGQAWTNDANTTKMLTNAIGWAARCL